MEDTYNLTASIFSFSSIVSSIVPNPLPVEECSSFSPRMRASAPSSFVVTSVYSNSGLALLHENDTFSLFDRDDGSSCSDSLGIKLIPSSIITTNRVFIEKADKRMF